MRRILGVAGTTGGVPGAPIIGSATAENGQATVSFTPPAYTGKGGTVTYRAISSPGGISATSTSSPITVTGLTNGTAYTFTVRAETSYGVSSAASSNSNSVTPVSPPSYSLSATLFSTQNWTVPNGVSKIAVYMFGGGGGGSAGGGSPYFLGEGGGGGGAGSGSAFKDYPVTPGTTYSVTIGAGGNASSAGGQSSFGNLAIPVAGMVEVLQALTQVSVEAETLERLT